MKVFLPLAAVFALALSMTGCEADGHCDHKDGCKCKESCTCPHCGKTADKCECGKK